jgi:hypothetical protein
MASRVDGSRGQPLTVRERRLLTAFYQPSNRRRAALALGAAFALWAAVWALAPRLWPRIDPHPSAGSQDAAFVFILAIPCAGFAGFYGLTARIRKTWPEAVETGPPWPENVRFPGPRREAAASFFTGRVPEFLRRGDPSTSWDSPIDLAARPNHLRE